MIYRFRSRATANNPHKIEINTPEAGVVVVAVVGAAVVVSVVVGDAVVVVVVVSVVVIVISVVVIVVVSVVGSDRLLDLFVWEEHKR